MTHTIFPPQNFWAFVCICLLLISCKKEADVQLEEQQQAKTTKTVTKGIPAFQFNWETADYMPTPPTHNILVPWANGAVKGFSSDIWYDNKMADGWELVYNQFNPNLPLPANPFFVLYNKYRGLLRIYIYVTTSGFTTSSYLTSGLGLSPNLFNSSMLNYIGQDIVNADARKAGVTKIEPTQIATGVWYASQYEIAYDPMIAGSTYQQTGLNWTLKWTNISDVDLGGTVTGTLNGTISSGGGGFDFGLLGQGALEAVGLSIFDNNKGPDPAHPGNGNKLGLPGFVFEAAKDGLTSGLSGVVKNIASAIFGGSSTSTQQVNLTLNANIKLNGSITNSGALIPDPGLGLGLPGTSNSQTAPGLVPYYNEPMGVFNISGKPLVNVTVTEETDGTKPNTYYRYAFKLDTTSFQPVFNPAVLAVAQIQNYRRQLLLVSSVLTGGYETIGRHKAVARSSYTVKLGGFPYSNAVRISFDVVPKNGAPRSKIVKTFWARSVEVF